MSNKNSPAEAPANNWTQITQDWTSSLQALVREETKKAAEGIVKEFESKLAASTPAAAPATAPAAGGSIDQKKIVEQVMNAPILKEKINQSLEQGLRGVLPQILQRLKQEIEGRVKDAPPASGGADPKANVKAVVNSAEMKEMLEDRFRMMLVYITQDVLPRELQKHGIGA